MLFKTEFNRFFHSSLLRDIYLMKNEKRFLCAIKMFAFSCQRATPERPHSHPSSSDLRCVLSLFCQPRLFIVIIYSFRYFRHPLILLFMNPPHTGRRATLTIVSALLLCGLRRLEHKSIKIGFFDQRVAAEKVFIYQAL